MALNFIALFCDFLRHRKPKKKTENSICRSRSIVVSTKHKIRFSHNAIIFPTETECFPFALCRIECIGFNKWIDLWLTHKCGDSNADKRTERMSFSLESKRRKTWKKIRWIWFRFIRRYLRAVAIYENTIIEKTMMHWIEFVANIFQWFDSQ